MKGFRISQTSSRKNNPMKISLPFAYPVWIGLLFLSLGNSLTLFAQQTKAKSEIVVNDTAYFDLNRDITEQLIPFEEIYQIALQYSPMMKVQGAMANSKLEAFRYSKVVALDNIYPYVNYAQGSQTLLATGSNPTDAFQLSNGTRWGFNVQVPLSTLFGRHNLVQQAKAEYQVTQHQKSVVALSLKRELIHIYQDLLVAQRVMNARLRDEQVALTTYRVTEVELQQGKAQPAQLSQISTIYTQAKSYAERARGDFMINYYDLEALIGTPLRTLMVK